MARAKRRREFADDVSADDVKLYLKLKKALDEKRAEDRGTTFEVKRKALLEECPHPLALAQRFDQTIVSTPAMELISRSWVETFNTYNGRLQVSCPPQMGKSTVAQFAMWWALLQDPTRRIVFASYSMSLARKSSWQVRNLVDTHGAEYGLTLEPTRHDVANWRLAGHPGGLTARGCEAGLTGEPCDLMVVDDLLAGEAEAQSKTIREKVDDWWSFVARTRMAPGVPAVAIGTRWHHEDILARFIREGWKRINIPAVADGKTEDALNREPGQWLTSTRGHTVDDWLQLQKDTSVRAFQSLYMGNPVPIEGSIFRQEWFDASRIIGDLPKQFRSLTVGVDPADTGTGDEAGILVAGTTLSGELIILADLSGKLGEFAWARTACIAWIEWDANRILQERQTGFRTSIDTAWELLYRQAVALVGYGSVEKAAEVLLDGGDHVAADEAMLREIVDIAEKIVDNPAGPRVVSQTPKQAKIVRAESAAGMFQRGKAKIYGYLPNVEFECVSLVENYRESPGRVDVLSMLTIAELQSSRSKIIA